MVGTVPVLCLEIVKGLLVVVLAVGCMVSISFAVSQGSANVVVASWKLTSMPREKG